MTVRAYVLIQTEVGKAAAVAEQISGLEGIVNADDVTGAERKHTDFRFDILQWQRRIGQDIASRTRCSNHEERRPYRRG